MNFFNKLFKGTSSEELREMLAQGAELIDVRTRAEYNEGHAKNSRNIPLDEFGKNIRNLNKEKVYVLVCASGMRSRTAVSLLKQQGFTQVYNGGSWTSFL